MKIRQLLAKMTAQRQGFMVLLLAGFFFSSCLIALYNFAEHSGHLRLPKKLAIALVEVVKVKPAPSNRHLVAHSHNNKIEETTVLPTTRAPTTIRRIPKEPKPQKTTTEDSVIDELKSPSLVPHGRNNHETTTALITTLPPTSSTQAQTTIRRRRKKPKTTTTTATTTEDTTTALITTVPPTSTTQAPTTIKKSKNRRKKFKTTTPADDSDGITISPAEAERLRLMELFKPAITGEHYQMYVNTLRGCVEIIESVNASYFIYGGTLIGWYRHNASIIPWDDDVDFALLPTFEEFDRNLTLYMDLFQRRANDPEFIQRFSNFSFSEQGEIKLKCFSTSPQNSIEISGVEWRWPFIDIHFMHIYANSTWERVFDPLHTELTDVLVEDPRESNFQYPLDWVFPLTRSKFESIDVFIPRRVEPILNLTYDLKLCEAMWYNHRLEEVAVKWDNVERVNCTQLTEFFNFTNLDVIYGRMPTQTTASAIKLLRNVVN